MKQPVRELDTHPEVAAPIPTPQTEFLDELRTTGSFESKTRPSILGPIDEIRAHHAEEREWYRARRDDMRVKEPASGFTVFLTKPKAAHAPLDPTVDEINRLRNALKKIRHDPRLYRLSPDGIVHSRIVLRDVADMMSADARRVGRIARFVNLDVREISDRTVVVCDETFAKFIGEYHPPRPTAPKPMSPDQREHLARIRAAAAISRTRASG